MKIIKGINNFLIHITILTKSSSSLIRMSFINRLVICQIKSKIIDPWEKTEGRFASSLNDTFPKFVSNPIDLLYSDLIGLYQSRISAKTIQRCPFYISCSNYTKIAVNEYGSFLGILYFIDRNFYRENIEMNKHYSLQKKGRFLKYDDSYYLSNHH